MQIDVTTGPAENTSASDLIIFAAERPNPIEGGTAQNLDQILENALMRLCKDGEITGKLGQCISVHTLDNSPPKRLLVAGLGPLEKIDLDRIRNVIAHAAREVRNRPSDSLAVALDENILAGFNQFQLSRTVTEGLLLGLYRFEHLRSVNNLPNNLTKAILHGEDIDALKSGRDQGAIIAEAVNYARDLANEPSNLLTPTEMAIRAEKLARETGLGFQVIEESEAAELGMGSYLGVAKGSHESAKFIVLSHKGGGDEPGLGLIGKGITFDTGGISLKPSASMTTMKQDMSGGGAVIAAIGALARLKVPINVTALVPTTENMPGGAAIKPGDVLTAINGKTIEVLNTDAEGRLILADALGYANRLGLSPLLDVATLTGACAVALGTTTTGMMTNDDKLGQQIIEAGRTAGEKIWQLPMFDEYDDLIKSPIADVKNVGGRNAGAITAAKFLALFAEKTPWVHLDIAGTDDVEKDQGALVKGATGVAVRTLVQFALQFQQKTHE